MALLSEVKTWATLDLRSIDSFGDVTKIIKRSILSCKGIGKHMGEVEETYD